MNDFKDKVVIVTGASSGIGEATAKEFATRRASLVLTGRNVENLNAVAEDCEVKGANDVLTVLADFENQADIENVIERAVEKFGRINILINNAGVNKGGKLEAVTEEDFDWILRINIKSIVYLTQLAMPHLVKSKGNIVNVSSIFGKRQSPSNLLYSMSKAALDQFTKTIALEYASKGVRVNSVNPGHLNTNISRYKGWSVEEKEKHYADLAKKYPFGRIGKVEEIAKAVTFLASDASSWTTGQCYFVDGGISLS